MEQRVSLITLGVADLEKSAAFYTDLGWEREPGEEGVIAFNLTSQTLGLYPKSGLAMELGIDVGTITGFSGIVLSHNVRTKEEVAPLLARAQAAGGTIVKDAEDVFWGGHHGHFADLDGHIWEVAHNPFSNLGPKGEFQWGGVE